MNIVYLWSIFVNNGINSGINNGIYDGINNGFTGISNV